jgi:hypothetical protein
MIDPVIPVPEDAKLFYFRLILASGKAEAVS